MVRPLVAIAFLTCIGHVVAQQVSDHKKVYKYTCPEGYKQNNDRVPGGRVAYFAAPKDGYSSNVMITLAQAGTFTADKIGQDSANYMKSGKDKSIKFIRGNSSKLGGKPAYTIVMDQRLGNGLMLTQQQVIAVNNGQAVIFTFSSTKKEFAARKSWFEKSLKSFAWLN